MKFSVFTPTHDPHQLARAARSVAAQTLPAFEWVVLANGGASVEDVRAAAPQAMIVEVEGKHGIGALKRMACSHCTGDVLVELDHDDELTPDCLAVLADAFADGTDFCYSDTAEIRPDGSPNTYSAAYGWQTYEQDGMVVLRAFDPSAASFSRVWYGPNHVRAWRRDFYERVGGHDVKLDVLDDHDLVARTFIEGQVRHVERCLYRYHWTDKNTCQSALVNPKIQQQTLAIHDQYIQRLVEREMRGRGLPLVDLCSGDACPAGWLGVDLRTGVDLSRYPWPFADSSVGAFRAWDALEHLPDRLGTMKEIYRCLVPGGWLLSETPSTDGRGAFQDPTHVSYWNSNAFWYYCRESHARYIGTPVRFQLARVANHFPSDFYREHEIVMTRAHLVSLKDGFRPPGAIEV